MFEEILIPLILTDSLTCLRGKTRFQKLVYLIQDETAAKNIQGSSFTYELSHYGPFSSDLSSVLDDLLDHNFLKERVETTPAGYTRYVYFITDKGKAILERARRKALLSKRLIHIIKSVADEYGELPLSDLVEEAYQRYSQ